MKGLKIGGIVLISLIMAMTVIANHKLIKRSDEVIAKADAFIERYENERNTDSDDISVFDMDDIEVTDSAVELMEEEVEDDPADSTDRYIIEQPQVYEEYQTEAEEVYTTKNQWEDGRYQFTSDELWEMTRIVYLENGIVEASSDETIYLTACVILNRLYDWDECHSIYEVIWEDGQYSTANRYTDYDGSDLGTSNPDGWQRSKDAVYMAIDNCDRNPHFQSTFAQGEIYYTDPITGEIFCY